MISVDGLAVEFGGTALFSDISFVINEKDRIALMGKNGAGKKYAAENFGRRTTTDTWKSFRAQRLRSGLSASTSDDGRRKNSV